MKKFIISSDELKKALNKVGQAVNEKTVLPIMKNIYCKVGKDEVELITGDLEITISYKCPLATSSEDTFELLLPYAYLHDIVSKMKNEPIIIEHPSVRKARVICSDDKFEINSLDKFEDFPKLPSTPKKNSVKLDAGFITMLQAAMLTVSTEEARPSMQRTLLDITPEESYLVSTDAHFLYRHAVKLETTETTKIQISAKMAKVLKGVEAAELLWTEKQVAIKNDTLCIWCRMFDDKYPDYRVVIPSYPANTFIDKAVLADALEKACINSNFTKQTNIYLKKEEGFIHFETNDEDYNRKGYVKRAGSYTGESESISINARKLLTILDQFDAEKIQLHIQSGTKGMLITTEEDPGYLGMLMPLMN